MTISSCCDSVREFKKNQNFEIDRQTIEYAIRSGHLICLKYMVEYCNVNTKTDYYLREESLLNKALKYGEMECAIFLIENGADINELDIYGNTALHCMVLIQNINRIKFLLSSGADVNKHDHNGYTPLHAACTFSSRRVETIKILLDYGADVNILYEGETIFDSLSPEETIIIKKYIEDLETLNIKEPED